MTDLETLWRSKTDAEVIEAATSVKDYSAEAQSVIRAEMVARQLELPADTDAEREIPQSIDSKPDPSGRPLSVTLIFAAYVLFFSFSLLSVMLVSFRAVGSRSVFDKEYSLWAVVLSMAPNIILSMAPDIITLAGSVRLFLLRKNAVYLFGIALALNADHTARKFAMTDWRQTFFVGFDVSLAFVIGQLVATFGWLAMVPVYIYAYRLGARGTLR